MELRTLQQSRAKVRVEKREDGKRFIKGYAAVYYREGDKGTEYALWDDLFERILPGAFDEAIKDIIGSTIESPSLSFERNLLSKINERKIKVKACKLHSS